MRVVIAADHRGFRLKEHVANNLAAEGYEVVDLGTQSEDPVDYPDVAVALGREIQSRRSERGILVCGSGVGASVAVNKLAGVRGAVCHDIYSAHQGVEHDDMNVLCLGSGVIGSSLGLELARAFLEAEFDPEERYVRRLEKVNALESGWKSGDQKRP